MPRGVRRGRRSRLGGGHHHHHHHHDGSGRQTTTIFRPQNPGQWGPDVANTLEAEGYFVMRCARGHNVEWYSSRKGIGTRTCNLVTGLIFLSVAAAIVGVAVANAHYFIMGPAFVFALWSSVFWYRYFFYFRQAGTTVASSSWSTSEPATYAHSTHSSHPL